MTTIDGFRLSPVQQREWERGPAELTLRITLDAPLDRDQLTTALIALTARHEALRLRLVEYPGLRIPLQETGDSALSLSMSDDELTIRMSTLVGDHTSLAIVADELMMLYGGGSLPEDDERLQFLDVSEWQLEEGPQPRPVPVADRPTASALDVPLGDDRQAEFTGLADVATRFDCSLESLLLGAWTLVLARYADPDVERIDLDWCWPGRSADGTGQVVGPLAARTLLRLPVGGDLPRFFESVHRAAEREAQTLSPVAPGFPAVAAFTSVRLPDSRVSIEMPTPGDTAHLRCELSGDTVRLTVNSAELLDSLSAVLTSLPEGRLQLSGPEESALLAKLSGGGTLPGGTLTELLDRGIAGAPTDSVAVIAEDGSVTFAELDRAANAVAAHLVRLGIGAEDRVVVPARRSWRTVAAFVGVLRAGAAYVPIDPDERRGLVEAASAKLVLDELPEPDAEPVLLPHVGTGQAAYVIFTSGSTGTPRPVVVEQGSAAHLCHALAQTIYADEQAGLRVSVNAPLTFDASIKQLVQLAAGHSLVLIPEETRLDVRALPEYLAEHRVDVFDCTPSHLRALLSGGVALPRLLLIGGEAIDATLWNQIAALPDTRAVNVYGPTESTVDVTAEVIAAGTEPSIGRPLPGTSVWVLDDQQRPRPFGVAGELCASGPQVARGYLGDPEATAQRFVTVDGKRLYRTGDIVRFLPNGRLRYVGRADDQVKIRGHRVEPGEVESVLGSHPAVAGAAVVARDGRLAGYVVPGAGAINLATVDGLNPHETRYLYDEIFVQRTYLRHGITLREDAVVFDVGANIGMFSLFVNALCPSASIYAFEPLAPVFGKLEHNICTHGVKAELYDHGLSDSERDEVFTFYAGYSMMSGQGDYSDPAAEVEVIRRYLSNAQDDTLLGRVDELLEDRFREQRVPVRLRRLSDVITDTEVSRIDLLKIDVQRAELDVLRGVDPEHWDLVHQVVMEVHDAMGTPTEGRLDEVVDLLEDLGFRVSVEQDDLLSGTDRYSLHAVRPEYADDPRPVLASAESTLDRAEPAALTEWLGQRLPDYLVPASIMVLDEFPLTANGKLDRAALPTEETRSATTLAEPENPAERILVEAFQEVLGVAAMGVEDSFFEFGGDSIRAIQLQVAAAKRGLKFALRDIFAHQTVRELVRDGAVELAGTTAPVEQSDLLSDVDRALVPAGITDAYPMSTLQLGMAYHSALVPRSYHTVTTHWIAAPLDIEKLTQTLRDLTNAHPILRTSFDLGTFSVPMQLVHESVDIRFEDGDEFLTRPLDLESAPLFALRADRIDAEAFEIVLLHHHALLDGWSFRLFVGELVSRYLDLGVDPAPALPYRRFIELEREAVTSTESRRFWLDRLAGAAPALLVPRDQVPRISEFRRTIIPDGLGERVLRLTQAPLKSLLLAVHLRAQAEELARDEVTTGLVVGTRPGEDGSDRTLGLFLNTLPVTGNSGATSLVDLAERLWQAERDLMGHHLVPLAEIQRAVGRGPLFDVFFNFTRFHRLDIEDTHGAEIVESSDAAVDVSFSLAVDFEVDPVHNGLGLTFQYDGTTLPHNRIERMEERYLRLLDQLVTAPDQVLPAIGTAGVPATDAATDRVVDVWRDVLGVPPRDDADFFVAGGDSLLALRFVATLRKRHGVALDLEGVIEDGRFSTLVERVDAHG